MKNILKIFEPKQRDTVPNPHQAIQRLREQIDVIERKEQYVHTKINNLKLEAKNHLKNKNRKAALLSLKKSKLYEQNVASLEGTKLTMEYQIIAIENAITNYSVINALDEGNTVIRELNNGMDVDSAQNLLDDFQEERDKIKDVQDVLANSFSMDFDDVEIENELKLLIEDKEEDKEEDKLKNQIDEMKGIKVPKTPTEKSKKLNKENDDDLLADLEALY